MISNIQKTIIQLPSIHGIEQKIQYTTPNGCVKELCWDTIHNRIIDIHTSPHTTVYTVLNSHYILLRDYLSIDDYNPSHHSISLDWCPTSSNIDNILDTPIKDCPLCQITIQSI